KNLRKIVIRTKYRWKTTVTNNFKQYCVSVERIKMQIFVKTLTGKTIT
uniref:Uncharacterized protein n=1 Tax=Anopheles atroparvus TaxID=41427 RepID=A0AAG5CY98_ANOAO